MLKGLLLNILCFCLYFGQIQSKHVADVNLVQKGPTLKGTIHVLGKPYHLNLKAAKGSVFAPDFKLTIPEKGPNGETKFRDITPSKNELFEMERKVYSDVNSSAVLQIHHAQGELRVHGILDNMHISHDGKSHFALIHDNPRSNYVNTGDYLNPPENRRDKRAATEKRDATMTEFKVEVFYVIDNALYNQLGQSLTECTNYLQLITRAVNNRYATSRDPLFVFQITGAWAMTTLSHQASFMEACPAYPGSNAYDIYCSLRKFGEYMAQKKETLQKHDVAALLSGANWMNKLADGTWASNISGLAYVSTACQVDSTMSLKVSVNWDKGAPYTGYLTLAHEFAHNLGSTHDGEADSNFCPWDDGYIMSYKGWGTENKVYFSKCSLNSMKAYANSERGACLRNKDEIASSPWDGGKTDLGYLYTMKEQCRRFTGIREATFDGTSTPDELCRNLNCKYTAKCPSSYGDINCDYSLKRPAFDNTACGTNGRCSNGKCLISFEGLAGLARIMFGIR